MAAPQVDPLGEGRTVVMEVVEEKTILETEALVGPDGKLDYPPVGTNSIYTAILSRNEAVKDAKRLKTFLELRDKYVHKKVLFEDPLFPADDSSLYYSCKSPMKFEWKRPSVSFLKASETIHDGIFSLFFYSLILLPFVYGVQTEFTLKHFLGSMERGESCGWCRLICEQSGGYISRGYHLLESQSHIADGHR